MPELVWMPEKTSYIICRNLTYGSSVFKSCQTFYLSIQERGATQAAALSLSDYSVCHFNFDDKVEVVGHLRSLVIDKIGD